MQELFQNFMNLEKPVLTEKLAPKIAPYAKIIYLVVLLLLGLSVLTSLGILFISPFAFIGTLFFIVVEFLLVRMFCEYLTNSAK